MRLLAAPILCFILALAAPAQADSWPGPVTSGVASPDGSRVVRVIPGESIGDTFGFAGAKKGRYARAHFYRLEAGERYARYQEVDLLNPVAPQYIALSNAGELVTLDNWHNVGHGKAIAVYGPDGRVRRSYALADVYSPEEVGRIPQSTSSIWWRCPAAPVLGTRGATLTVQDVLGNAIEVDLETGLLARKATRKGC